MSYRKLTEREIATFIEEQTVYGRWRAYAAYALQVYGPRSDRVVVASEEVYNDESYDLRITHLAVYDAAGAELEPDWTTDWWQTTLGDGHAELTPQSWDPEDWDDERVQAMEDAQGKLPIPPHRDEFAVHTPPARRFPAVYVPHEQ